MIIRRIVFGEPKPGESEFAGLLSGVHESVSYCNRTGPRGHDRVTDLPFTLPLEGLNLVHPIPLSFVDGGSVGAGEFSWHHMPLYLKGIDDGAHDPWHVQCARLCARIYDDDPASPVAKLWDATGDTNGVFWAAVLYEINAVRKAIFVNRGSRVFEDWVRDITPIDPGRIIHHDQFGAVWGGFFIGTDVAWQAMKPIADKCDEITFTGHSLGAVHADAECGYAILSYGTSG